MKCLNCGYETTDNINFCRQCGTELINSGNNTQPNVSTSVSENFTKGILGALLGSLIGVALIILLSQLGFVASISGYVMAISTVYLYEKFAGYNSKKGIITCLIIMIIMTVLAVNISTTIQIMQELSADGHSGDALYIFFNLYSLMSKGYINVGGYMGNLIMILIFTGLGSYRTFSNLLMNTKQIS